MISYTSKMIYETPVKDEDGCYIVKVKSDEGKKCLIQLKNVSVRDVGSEVEIKTKNFESVKAVDDETLSIASERSVEWFKKELGEDKLKAFYTPSFTKNTMTAEKINATRVFNPERESIPFDIIKEFKTCDVLMEFAGVWFAKKTFGPIWNIVQVKLVKPKPEPVPEPEPEAAPEPEAEEEYPEECIIGDDSGEEETAEVAE